MTRGRPPLGSALVERLQGSPEAKRRLQIILQTLAGQLAIPEACQTLGIAETRFHDLRRDVLQDALAALEAKPRGRPPRPVSPDEQRLAALERQMQSLQLDLDAARIREELALVMPHVLHPPGPARPSAKKKPR